MRQVVFPNTVRRHGISGVSGALSVERRGSKAVQTIRSGYVLWLAGIVPWVVVMYAFFTAAVVRETKPSLETGINGARLLGIVATQSVSVSRDS